MVHPDRLERYKDFVAIHSDLVDGQPVYNPKRALTGLLSVLSPDPKVVVLAGMNEGAIYFSGGPLYTDTLTWLNNLGIKAAVFPITAGTPWEYLEFTYEKQRYDGSLVEIGAVVKEAHLLPSWGDPRTGYMKSNAGSELAIPLLPYAYEFVFSAQEYAETQKSQGKTPHKFDSMWRIIGSANSNTGQRRPWAVFKVTEFLLQNPGNHRRVDLVDALAAQIDTDTVISEVLNKLGKAGIIDYQSPDRDIDGKKARGWSRYRLKDRLPLQDIGNIYQAIRRVTRGETYKRGFTDKSCLLKTADYILQNPDIVYEANELAKLFKIDRLRSMTVLSLLARIGALQSERGFKGAKIHSLASANYLTRMFYEMLLIPIKEVADTLTPPAIKPLDPQKLTYFLQNYQSERSNIGPKGGEEVRYNILAILANYPAMKLSHVAQEYNQHTERQLSPHSIRKQLEFLTAQGLAGNPKRGYYSLVSSPYN